MPKPTLLEMVDNILAISSPMTSEAIIKQSKKIGRITTPTALGTKLVRNGYPHDVWAQAYLFYAKEDF